MAIRLGLRQNSKPLPLLRTSSSNPRLIRLMWYSMEGLLFKFRRRLGAAYQRHTGRYTTYGYRSSTISTTQHACVKSELHRRAILYPKGEYYRCPRAWKFLGRELYCLWNELLIGLQDLKMAGAERLIVNVVGNSFLKPNYSFS